MTRLTPWRLSGGALLFATVFAFLAPATATAAPAQQEATPTVTYSCDTATPQPAMPGMDHGDMAMGTPMAGMEISVEFDQLYIDMMIPHHASIIAMAQAALPRLTDSRLQEIANNIITAQTAEIAELRGYRQQFYGSSDPVPLDPALMEQISQQMPGMGPMDDMTFQMDATAQVAAICAAPDPDLAFIDLAIPHHKMAIVASEPALTQASHQEIKDFAQRIITDQQGEVTELTAIRAELSDATPPVG